MSLKSGLSSKGPSCTLNPKPRTLNHKPARPCKAAVKYSEKYKYWYSKKKEEVFEADTTYTTFGSIPGRGLHSSTF